MLALLKRRHIDVLLEMNWDGLKTRCDGDWAKSYRMSPEMFASRMQIN